MSRKNKAAMTGDLGAALSEECQSAPKEVLIATQKLLEREAQIKPEWKPTHIYNDHHPVVLLGASRKEGRSRMRYESGRVYNGYTDLLKPIEEEKPEFVPTHIYTGNGNNTPVMVTEGNSDRHRFVMALWPDSREMQVESKHLKRIEKPEFVPTHYVTNGRVEYPAKLLGSYDENSKLHVEYADGRREIVMGYLVRSIKDEKRAPAEPQELIATHFWLTARLLAVLAPEEEANYPRLSPEQTVIRLVDGPRAGHTKLVLKEELRSITQQKPKSAKLEELVEFTICWSLMARGALSREIEDAFGFEHDSYSVIRPLIVTCRPDQFGRFVAMLAKRGVDSGKLTSIRLFKPHPKLPPNAIDARYLGLPE